MRTGSGIRKGCGKNAGRLAAPATILEESLKGKGRPGDGLPGVETSSPSRWGCCKSYGRRERAEAAAGSSAWEGAAGVRRAKPACCRGCKSPTGKEVANPS